MNTENRTSAQDRTTYKAEAKWGAEIMAKGFTIVPNIFLSQQHVLGLSSPQCLLLLHLMTYWWEPERNPFPSKAILAQRMGLSERQVQRHISDLIKAGFLRRRQETLRGRKGRFIISFDMSGLVKKLQDLDGALSRPGFAESSEGS